MTSSISLVLLQPGIQIHLVILKYIKDNIYVLLYVTTMHSISDRRENTGLETYHVKPNQYKERV